MTDDDLKVYDTAAATLQRELEAAYPDYTWRVPTTDDALFDEMIKEMVYGGWLVLFVLHRGHAAWMKATLGVEQDAAAVRAIGQQMIGLMDNPYRHMT